MMPSLRRTRSAAIAWHICGCGGRRGGSRGITSREQRVRSISAQLFARLNSASLHRLLQLDGSSCVEAPVDSCRFFLPPLPGASAWRLRPEGRIMDKSTLADALLQSAGDAIVATDRDGLIMLWN